jgi:hypothetical protein
LVLSSVYLGATANSQTYKIVPVAGYTRSLARKTGELVSDYSLAHANRVVSVSGRTGDVTKEQLLTDLKTIDGTGSGLDADTVDGKHASDFVPAVGGLSNSAGYLSMAMVSGTTCAELFATTLPGSTSIREIANATDAPAMDWWMIESARHNDGSSLYGTQIAHGWQANAGKVWERTISGGTWSAWRRIISSASSGNVLIGTDTDNGVDKLQVNGTISEASIPAITANLNDLKTLTKKYVVSDTSVNLPLAGEYFYIEVIIHVTGQWHMQRATALGAQNQSNGGRVFSRVFMNGTTWSNWKEL